MKKKTQSILFGSLLAPGVLCGQVGFTNVIEMVELGAEGEAPLLWNMPGNIAAEGNSVQVDEPVPEAGALFILSTIQASPFQDFFLDQTAVGAYLPKAEIQVKTHDQESMFPRTRADRPIEVSVEVTGLYDPGNLDLLPEEIQQAAREVRLQAFSQSYPEGQSSLPGGEVTNAAYAELALVGNGEFPKEEGDLVFFTNLNPSAPDLARGEEHFIVRSLDDSGIEGSALDQKRVQVWPVWSGGVSGLTEPELVPYVYDEPIPEIIARLDGELNADEDFVLGADEIGYEEEPPEVTFTWNDLYPTSTVAIIVNDADIPYPWGGRLVGGTTKQFNEDQSHNHVWTVENWDGVFGEQGRYAVWMVTHTPGIGWEVGGNFINGNLQEGGWVIPIQRKKITVRASIQSLK